VLEKQYRQWCERTQPSVNRERLIRTRERSRSSNRRHDSILRTDEVIVRTRLAKALGVPVTELLG
jgi:hypothetical protein